MSEFQVFKHPTLPVSVEVPQEYLPKLQAGKSGGLAQPADVLQLLPRTLLDGGYSIGRILLLPEDPNGIKFDALPGEVRLYAPQAGRELEEVLLSAWALRLFQSDIFAKTIFRHAAELETEFIAHPICKNKIEFNFAYHLGNYFLSPDPAMAEMFFQFAPLRSIVFSFLLRQFQEARERVEMAWNRCWQSVSDQLYRDGRIAAGTLMLFLETDEERLKSIQRVDLSPLPARVLADRKVLKCTNLIELSLARADYRAIGVDGIATELRQLERLDVSGTPFSNSDLMAFTNMPKLKELNLAGTHVTAEAVGRLAKQGLELRV